MKTHFNYLGLLLLFLLISSCEDNLLDTNINPVNTNDPTLNATVSTVAGLETIAKGVYPHTIDGNRSVYFWFVYGYHETMGDVMTMPWGNFGGRWVNQTQQVILDDGTTVNPPAGGPQPGEIAQRNTRGAGSDNMTQYEWFDMYALNSQSNIILAAIENLTDATPSQEDAFRAWALWWKAYAYHRIGSMYEQGLVVNEVGEINNNFVNRTEIISESNNVLTQLSAILDGVSDVGAFNTSFNNFQLDISESAVNLEGLRENINTLRARNLVYNTKVVEMTESNWNSVIQLTNEGVLDNDQAFIMKSENTVLDNAWLPGRVTGFWYLPSPRLIQDINDGDARLLNYFEEFNFPNPRGRGIQYGCNYFWLDESPIVSSVAGNATMFYAGSHEENLLLRAEAKIRTSDIEGGLADLDTVRSMQGSGLAPTVGAGFTEDQALEEIRKERRLALIMRSVNFYDARRYGVSSGNRTGAHVLDQDGNLNTNATITYGYLDYWPVPAFESDFNPPGGSQN